MDILLYSYRLLGSVAVAFDKAMPILPRRSPVIDRRRDHNVRDIHARITGMRGSVLRGGVRPGARVSR
jgi:hypothetical protein